MADTAVLEAPAATGAIETQATGDTSPTNLAEDVASWLAGEDSGEAAADEAAETDAQGADEDEQSDEVVASEEPNPWAGLDPAEIQKRVAELIAEKEAATAKDTEARIRESERQKADAATTARARQQFLERAQRAQEQGVARGLAKFQTGFSQLVAKAAETGETLTMNPKFLADVEAEIVDAAFTSQWIGIQDAQYSVLQALGFTPTTEDLGKIQDAAASGDARIAVATMAHLMFKAALATATADVEKKVKEARQVEALQEAATKANSQKQPLRIQGTSPGNDYDQVLRGKSSDPASLTAKMAAFKAKHGADLFS